MANVFISYSAKDSKIALWLHEQLVALNVDVFLAELNIQGGKDWKPVILENLRTADFVIFLATPNSCKSHAVSHEIGGALVLQKTFVPIMAGIKPKDLPEWIQDKQAVDIYDSAKTRDVFERIASAVKSKRFIAGIIVGVLLAAALHYCTKKK